MPTKSGSVGERNARQEEDRASSRSRRSALTQLRFGRAAHLLSIIAAIILVLAAIVALISNWVYAGVPPDFLDSMKWFLPLVAGAGMAIVTIYLKWEPFFTDRTTKHFLTSIAAMIIPVLMIVLIALDATGYLDFGAGTWIYPISFIGMSLSIVSIAMIWDGMSRRKTISIVSALLPLMIMTLPMLINGDGVFDLLPLIFLGSAICFQLSGSMLHIISTSTSVQEREITRAGDAKLIKVKEDIERKQREIEFKEKALQGREVGFETLEKTLGDLKIDLDQREALVKKLEADLRTKDLKLREDIDRVNAKELSIGTREEKLAQKKMELESQEKEMEVKALGMQSKEGKLSDEKDKLQQEWTELRVLQNQLEQRRDQIRDELAAVKSNRENLERDQKALAEKEKGLQLRESSLEMRLRSTESAKVAPSDDLNRLKEWEQKILKKEEMMVAWQSQLADKQRSLEEKISEYERKIASVDERMRAVETKEKDNLEKEASVSRFEKDVASQREEVAQIFMQLDALRQETDRRKANYETMLIELQRRSQIIAKKEEDIKSIAASTEANAGITNERLQRLDAEKQDIENRRRSMLEMEKEIAAKSSQLQIKELHLKEKEAQIETVLQDGRIESSETKQMLDRIKEREKALELREKNIGDREREIRAKAISASKGETTEEVPSTAASTKTDKVGTGTKRLDDLLYGGLPKGSSVLFVGPPFSGKEIAIICYLAEGAKKGIPAIVVTTSKNPSELSKDFAPILPSLLELERLGLIRWIDATVGSAANGPPREIKYYEKVDGPDDFPAIIEALDRMTKNLDPDRPFFRLGYLSLSTSISHANEMEATKFIQAMVHAVRDNESTAMLALEKGMHTDQQIESIQHLLDGGFLIKLDKQKTFLSVIGIGETQTRDWVEFRHTSTGLIIGAFSLERIR